MNTPNVGTRCIKSKVLMNDAECGIELRLTLKACGLHAFSKNGD